MQIVIDIGKELAEKGHWYTDEELWKVVKAVQNGTVLPKKHGDLIDRDSLLNEIKNLQRSPWHNDERAMHTEYVIHEAVEVVRDICIYREKAVIEAWGNEE